MRRTERSITDNREMERIISEGKICYLAMAKDDEPYCVPLNFGYSTGRFYVHSAPEGRKIDILKRNPFVWLTITGRSGITSRTRACAWGMMYESVMVKGMITDISPGTEEYALRARFPDGVPAMSDANMSDWMLYVHKQFERPADMVGVDVTISVLDSNMNFYDIGTTTSDDSGFYSLMFEPPVPGEYTVYAWFGGSKAYYPSFSETALGVLQAPDPTAMPTPTPAPMTDTYVLGLGLSSLIAFVVIGLLLILMLRKR